MGYLDALHNHITHDAQWLEWSKITKELSRNHQNPKFNCDHGINHWLSVAKNAQEFARHVNADKHTIALADATGLLHDCGLICGDDYHAEHGANISRAFLRGHRILSSLLDDDDIRTICHAIAQHSNGNEISSIVDAAVLFADKIDVTKNRAVRTDDPITREVAKIQTVNYTITDKSLTIQYGVREDFKKDIFFGWEKAYLGPAKAAEFIGRKLVFIINGEVFNLPISKTTAP